ncbi:zinc ribbon domain-containing protein [Nodosilinea sp. E11]|uniref:zinc ribbon domain-containing protein n=1 Tax=Nodosilinea sp. E11 TaxID=3037479 RepID=UPI0029352997|nr:zinc ribbon domain-containing protein [Nodosilinea sp. E11]WOD38232.1 zinc ribbon domain-containing protein [Nodosilinea sp. E11]
MPYQCDLSPSQKIYLDNPGTATLITLVNSGPGQQQQSSTQVQTGPWTEAPQIVLGSGGRLIRCVAAQGVFIWQVQGMQIETTHAAAWPGDRATPMQVTAVSLTSPMQPMQPMQPMKMGDMDMSAQPMTMRMGTMSLGLGNTNTQTDKQKFCTQCGAAVDASDRFCGSCGHQLR